MLMHVERRDRDAEAGPHAVVIDSAGHDIDQHFVLADRPGRQHLDLHGSLGRAVTLLPDRPSVHPGRHVTKRRNFADFVEVFARRCLQRVIRRDGRHGCLRNCTAGCSLPHLMLHRNISLEMALAREIQCLISGVGRRWLTGGQTCATLCGSGSSRIPGSSSRAAVGHPCLAAGENDRDWHRQHYHHDHRRRDRRLVGRKHRARFWFQTALEHRHRHHRRLHRRLAAYSLRFRAVLRVRRLHRECRDRRRRTFDNRRLHQAITASSVRQTLERTQTKTILRREGALQYATAGSREPSRARPRNSARLRSTRRSLPLRASREYAALHNRRREAAPMNEPPHGATRARDKPWIFRTYAGHSNARDSNALYRTNLAKGQTGLSVAFDLPTQTGYDSDHPLAKGEVGKVGVPISHLGDMRMLFDHIPLGEMNTSMTINATAAWLLALYVALADEQGIAREKLQGTTQNDIIKEYLSRGTYVFPPAPSMRLTKDVILFTTREMPKWNPINVCSYHLQEAGATPVQELAFALATAIAVLDTVQASSAVERDAFGEVVGRISFFV